MNPAALEKLNAAGAREGLRELGTRLEASTDFSEAAIEAELRKIAEERGLKAGILINGSRAALTGQPVGPSAFHVFTALGRKKSIERLLAV
jgi:glutamyl-tRNA synthetase